MINYESRTYAIFDVPFFVKMGTEIVKYENKALSVALEGLYRKHVKKQVK